MRYLFPLVGDHSFIIFAPLASLQSTIDFLISLGFSLMDLRQTCSRCLEILIAESPPSFPLSSHSSIARQLSMAVTFYCPTPK
ncbi:hypothetical protein AXF42_Ash002917 [Apostasia shenzhenica]|uniref:Uncharacterized protein n=1 Tax=Apostasia shenzhenica TaxID=1088818 RepID=A0A2I0A7L7_9ASPA|nr:hypothetical protein AXF42_Ash002917 [Apostasia shenzhenica]